MSYQPLGFLVNRPVCKVVAAAAATYSADGDERILKERRPTATNNDELLELMDRTRPERRSWINDTSPTITEILARYPRLLDLHGAVSSSVFTAKLVLIVNG